MAISDITKSLALRISASGRFIVRAKDGTPFMIKADTAWEMCHRLTRDEIVEYLNLRRDQGFNVISTVALSELDGLNTPNAYGQHIFKDGSHDPTRPNEAYFQYMDWIFEEAARRGLTVFLVPNWGSYLNQGWNGAAKVIFNPENARAFGHYIGTRYPGLPKILGGDTNRFWLDPAPIWASLRSGEPAKISALPKTDIGPVVRAMAEGIKAGEREHGVDAFQTFHPTAMWLPGYPEARATAYFDEDWLTLDAVQTGHADFPTLRTKPQLGWWNNTAPHIAIDRMWNHVKNVTSIRPRGQQYRPVIDLEGHYEGMRNGLQATPSARYWNAHDIRNASWHGACGYVYGANSVWQMYRPGRGYDPRCGLDQDSDYNDDMRKFEGPKYLQHLSALFEKLNPEQLEARHPSQNLLLDGPVDGEERISVMSDGVADQKTSFIFAYSGKGLPFTLRYDASWMTCMHWMNPRDGTQSPVALNGVQTGMQTFIPPSSGSIEQDWALVMM